MDTETRDNNSAAKGFDVHVTKFITPTTFWAIRKDEHSTRFQVMQDELNDYFTKYDCKPLSPSSTRYPPKGEMIIVKHECQWHRGRVEAVVHSVRGYLLEAFLLDKAETVLVDIIWIRQMPARFLSVPFQAVRLILPNLAPVGLRINLKQGLTVSRGPIDDWDEASCLFVEKWIKDQKSAKTEVLNAMSATDFCVKLYWSHSTLKTQLCLNDELIHLGFAVYSPSAVELEAKSADYAPSLGLHRPEEIECAKIPKSSLQPSRSSYACEHLQAEWHELQEKLEQKIKATHIFQGTASAQPIDTVLKNTTSFGRGKKLLEMMSKLKQSNKEFSLPTSNIGNFKVGKIPSISPEEKLHRRSATVENITGFDSQKSQLKETIAETVSKHKANLVTDIYHQKKLNSSDFDDQLKPVSSIISPNEMTLLVANENRNSPYSLPPLQESSISRNASQNYNTIISSGLDDTLEPSAELLRKDFPSPLLIFDEQSSQLNMSHQFHDVLVYGFNPPKPVVDLQRSTFDYHLMEHLKELKFPGPNALQSHAWASLLRFRNTAIVGPRQGGKTISYLLPLISSLLQSKLYKDVPIINGPLILIVCSRMNTALKIFNACKMVISSSFSTPIRVHFLDSQSTRQNLQVQLMNGCEILIVTPRRLLHHLKKTQQPLFTLKRLCHLVLEECHLLMEENPDLIGEIMTEYKKTSSKQYFRPQQIVICSELWTPTLASYVRTYLVEPVLCISSLLEAVVFADIRIETHLCRSSVQDSILQEIMTDNQSQKVVISTVSIDTAKWLFQLLNSTHYTLLIHPQMDRHNIEAVNNQWKSLEKNAVIIIVDDSLPDCIVRDATCLIHYDLPVMSKTVFGQRFRCVAGELKKKHFAEELEPFFEGKAKLNSKIEDTRVLSHIIVTEYCAKQAPSLLEYLDRMRKFQPLETLRAFAVGSCWGREAALKELCPRWKAFGICNKGNSCKCRHSVQSEDLPTVPDRGQVKVLVTHVVHASCYYGRLLEHHDSQKDVTDYKINYLKLWHALQRFYRVAENCHFCETVAVGDLCTLFSEDDRGYYRVQVVKELAESEASVWFVDVGRSLVVKVLQLLELPDNLKEIPFQAIEIFLCNVQPLDNGFEWEEKTTKLVHNLIISKELVGKVHLALRSTFWLRPLQQFTYLEELKIPVKEFCIVEELKKNNLIVDYPLHMDRLQKACKNKFCEAEDDHEDVSSKSSIQSIDKLSASTTPLSCMHLSLDSFEVVGVVTIKSPHLFYVQKIEYHDRFNALKKELNDSLSQSVSEGIIVDQLYLVPFPPDNEWHRGKIEEIRDDNNIEVFSIDYGDHVTVTRSEVRLLEERWINELPAQAIQCSLFGIEPLDNNEWTTEASNIFWDLVIDEKGFYKDLVVKVVNKTDDNGKRIDFTTFEVLLYDTNEKVDLLINKELVMRNLAREKDEVKKNGWPFIQLETKESDLAVSNLNESGNENYCEKDTSAMVDNGEVQNNLVLQTVPNSHHAYVLWHQTNLRITLKFQLIDIKNYRLRVDETHIHFTAVVGEKVFNNDLQLYASIMKETKKEKLTGQYLLLTVDKTDHIQWPHLLKTTSKIHWVMYDFDHICVSDSDDEGEQLPFPLANGAKQSTFDIYRRTFNKRELNNSSDDENDDGDFDEGGEDFLRPIEDIELQP